MKAWQLTVLCGWRLMLLGRIGAVESFFFASSRHSDLYHHHHRPEQRRRRHRRHHRSNGGGYWGGGKGMALEHRFRAGHIDTTTSTHATTAAASDGGDEVVADEEWPDTSNGETKPCNKVLILMDGFCRYHGGYLGAGTLEYEGAVVIPVLSNYLCDYLKTVEPDDEERWESLRVPMDEGMQDNEQFANMDWKQLNVVAVYCESDSGLADAEALRERLAKLAPGLIHDEPIFSEARRNKFLMQQCVQEQHPHLRTVRQQLCSSLAEARAFAEQLLVQENHARVVVKPHRGVASESVSLCTTLGEVDAAWELITSSSVFGSREQHSTVLVQEFLVGTEYAVDVVSRNGEHKVAAVWRYDKRPANGAPFCYFKTELVDADMDEHVQAVCDHVTTVLNTLGVKWGLSHNEIIMVRDGDRHVPALVEINCRQHNMDFAPLTMACIGYNALDMVLEAFFGDAESGLWNDYPNLPSLRAHGCMVHLVNYASGRLVGAHHLDDIAALDSIFDMEVYHDFQTPGSVIEPTIDIRSDAGWVQLINDNAASLQQDFQKIVDWMPTMFQVTPEEDDAQN